MEDLSQEFLLENSSINVIFLENKTEGITAGAYFISISKNVNGVKQTGAGVLLIVNNYILGHISVHDFMYLFDSNSKYEIGNLQSSGTAVLIKHDTLYSLESYIRSVYYNTFCLTLYFKMQFIKIHCTANAKNAIKYELKK